MKIATRTELVNKIQASYKELYGISLTASLTEGLFDAFRLAVEKLLQDENFDGINLPRLGKLLKGRTASRRYYNPFHNDFCRSQGRKTVKFKPSKILEKNISK